MRGTPCNSAGLKSNATRLIGTIVDAAKLVTGEAGTVVTNEAKGLELAT